MDEIKKLLDTVTRHNLLAIISKDGNPIAAVKSKNKDVAFYTRLLELAIQEDDSNDAVVTILSVEGLDYSFAADLRVQFKFKVEESYEANYSIMLVPSY